MNSFIKKNYIVLYLFLIFTIFYITLTAGAFWESDSQTVFALTKSMIDKGQFSVDCFWETALFRDACYSKYGILSSISVIPFYLVEKLFIQILHSNYFFSGFFPSLTNCVITALLVALIYQYFIKFNFSKKLSVILAIFFGVCTYLPAYTKTLFAEPLLTLLIYGAFYILLFSKRTFKSLLWAGLLIGLSFLAKFSVVIFIPVFIAYFLIRNASFKQLTYFLTPIAVTVGIFFTYNYLRFSNILDTGYRDISVTGHPFFYGIYLHTLSPGKSLFLYQPFILFAFIGFRDFMRKQKLFGLMLAVFLIIAFTFYSVFQSPTGDSTWGSRYLYLTLPIFIFGVGFFIKNNKSKVFQKFFLGFILISLIIQLSSVYISYHRYYSFLDKKFGSNFTSIAYNDPQYSPLWGQWKLIFRLGYTQTDSNAWKEAFQDFPNFDLNYKIAPTDLFFFRSRREFIILLMILTGQIYLALRIHRLIQK